MTILKFVMWIYLTSLFFVVFFIIIETQVNKNPGTIFGKWWRKNIVGSGEDYDDGL